MINQDSEHVVTKSIVIKQTVERAFHIWTDQINAWWPAGHSISGDPLTQVFIESKAGGRFFERASNGVEYDWGVVQVWDPPHRLAFRWFLGSSQELPTQVEVQFVPIDQNKTRIQLEHRGPELIGELWGQRVSIFNASWDNILSKFVGFMNSQT